MQTTTKSERVTSTITFVEPHSTPVRPPIDYSAIPSVPDNCANCPDSSCCPFANDSWHGRAGYTE